MPPRNMLRPSLKVYEPQSATHHSELRRQSAEDEACLYPCVGDAAWILRPRQ